MNIEDVISYIFVFLIIFSVVIFMALPVGVRVPKKAKRGHASGAPDNPMIAPKLLYSALASVIITFVFFYFKNAGAFDIIFAR